MTEHTVRSLPRAHARSGIRTSGDRSRRVLSRVELATGASALVCGGLLVVRPDGSALALPLQVLDGTPFADWRMPGLLLAGLVGGGYLVAGTWERRRWSHRRGLSVLAGTGLVLFEAVEWSWLGFHPLQAIFMGVGATVVALAVTPGGATSERGPGRVAT